MKRVILSGILLTLLLSGCGGTKTTAEKAPAPESQPPAAEQTAPAGADRSPRRRSWGGRTGPCWR